MKICNLKIKNLKSFHDSVEINDLKSVNTFIGPNKAGKSNIIFALKWLREIANGQELSEDFEDLSFDHDENNEPRIEVEFELSDSEIKKIEELTKVNTIRHSKLFKKIKYICDPYPDGPIVEKLFVSNKTGEMILIIDHDYDMTDNDDGFYKDSLDLKQMFESNDDFTLSRLDRTDNHPKSMLHGAGGNYQTYWIGQTVVDFFKTLTIFDAYRKPSFELKVKEEEILNENGENLVNMIHSILSSDRKKYQELVDIISEIIGDVSDMTAPLNKENVTIHLKETGLVNSTSFKHLSVGLQQILILMMAIETAPKENVLCIEEPEIYIHPQIQKKLFQRIKEKSKEITFFLTTHSLIFADVDEQASTYLVTKSNGKSDVIKIQDRDNLRVIKKSLGIDNLDILGVNHVLFFEGESEENAFPIIAKALGHKTDKGFSIFNLKGNGNIKNIKMLLRYLKNSDVTPWLILDNDGNLKSNLDELVKENLLPSENVTILDGEFEDYFNSSTIVQGLKKIYNSDQIEIKLTTDDFEEKRKNRKAVIAIQEYLNQFHIPLHKPALATSMANVIAEEIKDNKTRTQTKFELEIEKLMKQLDKEKN